MTSERNFCSVTFERELDVKKLQAVLAKTMRTVLADTGTEAAPARLESVLMEPARTTVYLSGNGPTLDAVARAVCANHKGVEVAKATREDARRLPAAAG